MEPTSEITGEMEKENGKKAKECNQCNFTFASENSLRVHMRTCHGEKSHKCYLDVTMAHLTDII